MYIEKYIKDFDENMYKSYLSNPQKLIQLANAYVSQYSNPTYDCTIAFKESLDHYIVKKYSTDSSFINTTEFKNYAQYLNYTFSKRIGTGNCQLEYNTNVVFRNNSLRNCILSLYDANVRGKLESIINNNLKVIDNIYAKMANNESLSQSEFDLISDYLYTKRDFSDVRYSKFIEYILNNNKENISSSPQIIAAYIAYLPKIYGEGCEYSRAILSNGISKANDIESILPNEIDKYRGMKKLNRLNFYSNGNKYISMGWSFLSGLNLNGDLSLDHSRTMAGNGYYAEDDKKEEAKKYNDLYWISMTTFHEITHQLQNNSMKLPDINSSGLSQLIKLAKRNNTDNTYNHDSIESEIEADEVAWSKMYSLITKYRLNSNSNTNKKNVETQLKKCIINKESVYARRAIRTKYKSNERFFAADVKEIQTLLNDSNIGAKYKIYFRNILSNYPMSSKVFDENGHIKTTILFDSNLTSKNKTGNDENILACELVNYILGEGYSTLKRHLINDNLSKPQIISLMMNVYNTYHLEKKFINSLAKLDFSQLEETHTNFDYKNKDVLISKYLEKFRNVAELVYKERELITIINKKYPEYRIEEVANPKYACWNYQDMFNHLFTISNGIIEYDKIRDIIEKYKSSGDPILVGIANETKKRITIPANDFDFSGKKL